MFSNKKSNRRNRRSRISAEWIEIAAIFTIAAPILGLFAAFVAYAY